MSAIIKADTSALIIEVNQYKENIFIIRERYLSNINYVSDIVLLAKQLQANHLLDRGWCCSIGDKMEIGHMQI